MIKLTSLVVSLVFVLIVHHCCDGRRPYVNHPTCPRRQDTSEPGRPCPRKKCRITSDCLGRNRRCVCDDVCGMSCVRRTVKRCRPVRDVEHGRWELSVASGRRRYRVGSVVRYTCDEGYTLYGPVERVCQPNGSWTDATPSCRITTSGVPGWTDTGTKRCQSPPIVRHGYHDASARRTSFPVGTQLVYRCRRGYNMDGPFLVICVDEGRWVGPHITCSPRSCGHPGEIANGVRNGSVFTYEHRVSYSCLPGFELCGRPYRVCLASGRWSGKLPACRPIACEKLSAPVNGQIISKERISRFGSNVTFTCNKGYQLIGSASRTCLTTGAWSGVPAVCKRTDCGDPGPFPNGRIIGERNTTVGSVIRFRCLNTRMQFEGKSENTECLPNGTWSNPIPKCWSPCLVPNVSNGNVEKVAHRDVIAGAIVSHGSIMQYRCNDGFRPKLSNTTCCNNGTWLTTPVCGEAPCVTGPSHIINGIVRYHRQNHGDRALYECDFGYTMVGSSYLVCQYGVWVNPSGMDTKCQPSLCDYPGNITNGHVLLVGHLGRYDYRPYVQAVRHNDNIEYECDEYFRLVGPAGSTCVNGTWSPSELPTCQPKQHQHRYYLYPNDRSFVGQLRRASLSRSFRATV